MNGSCHDPLAIIRPPIQRLYHILNHRRLLARLRESDLIRIEGCDLIILPGVFHPSIFRSGVVLARLLSDYLPRRKLATFLDMGTGSGISACIAARTIEQVVAVDIHPLSVRNAEMNCRLNRISDRVTVLQSDLFSALSGRMFDCISFNPPYYRGKPSDGAALYGGEQLEVIDRFAREARSHLNPGGVLLLFLSTLGCTAAIMEIMTARGFHCRLIEQRETIIERFFFLELTGGI